ncbi:MAG: ferredoxin--NADP reductase [Bacteroidetes bacterium]|nr:ferredoxin--NADP reductase [Bacteroidota bacterium]
MSNQYFTLKVAKVVKETQDAITIHFEHPPDHKIAYKPGQYLTLIVNANGEKSRRAYSLCSSPNEDVTLAVTVKKLEGGTISNYLNDNLKPGDPMEIMVPTGTFAIDLVPGAKRHLVLFGAGSGITPLMSIMKSVLAAEPHSQVSLVYGNRDEGSIIFKDDIDELKKKYGSRFNFIHVLTRPADGWDGPKGRINKIKVSHLLEQFPEMGPTVTDYYICGPQGMMDEVKSALESLNVAVEKIHKESFTAPLEKEDESLDEEREKKVSEFKTQDVKINYEGQTHTITVKPDTTILETALDEGIDLPYSCQSGLCTTCRCKLLSGEVHMDEREGLSDMEIDEGYVLICQGHPVTAGVVLEAG